MTKVEALLEQAKALSDRERKELASKLQHSVRSRSGRRSSSGGPYGSLLELAGSADSDFKDVSRRKKKHLGAVYARRRP